MCTTASAVGGLKPLAGIQRSVVLIDFFAIELCVFELLTCAVPLRGIVMERTNPFLIYKEKKFDAEQVAQARQLGLAGRPVAFGLLEVPGGSLLGVSVAFQGVIGAGMVRTVQLGQQGLYRMCRSDEREQRLGSRIGQRLGVETGLISIRDGWPAC